MNLIKLLFLLCCLLMGLSLHAQNARKSIDNTFQNSHPEAFSNYWFQGESEISRYSCVQTSRVDSVQWEIELQYSTTDFLLPESGSGVKKLSILKLDKSARYGSNTSKLVAKTTIYTPIDYRKYAKTLKVDYQVENEVERSTTEINLRENQLYFETKSTRLTNSDSLIILKETYLEDDIWSRLRLEPQMLPLGKIEMIPSVKFIHESGKELKAFSAVASLVLEVYDSKDKPETYLYVLRYPELNRELMISCESKFPYKILWWEERSGSEQVIKSRLESTFRQAQK